MTKGNEEPALNRYDRYRNWGKKPNPSNQGRIYVTRSLIPDNVRTILDLGCGDGIITNDLIEKGIDVYGIDFSVVALGFMKGKRSVSDVDRIPFPDQCFDLVLCAEVIEHLPYGVYERTLSEIERVSRQYIIISTPGNEYLPSFDVKCNNCGTIFHRSLHVRSFDRETHNSLFGLFDLKKAVGVGVRRESPGIIDFQRKVLGVYNLGRGGICPTCNRVNDSLPGIWQGLVLVIGKAITYLIPGARSDHWIVSLYHRNSNR
jgi:SAM-dependent methyltransferase